MLPSLSSAMTTAGAHLPPARALYRPMEQDDTPHYAPVRQDAMYLAIQKPERRVSNRAKSNSERGKEFRAKRKKYEAQLETSVYKLRAHVSELAMKKGVWEKQILDARHTDSGSLVRLINEYFTLFRFGLRTPDMPMAAVAGSKRALVISSKSDNAFLEKIKKQEEFVSRVMDSGVMVGEKEGPAASLAQWRMYTLSHDSLRNEPYLIRSCGSEEQPCVEVLSNIYARISLNTFRYIFPGAIHNQELVQRFLNRDVVYKSLFRFHFTEDNKIAIEAAEIGIVEGLQDAGFALEDIAQLMQQTVLTPQCMIPEPEEAESPNTSAATSPQKISPTASKLSLDFVLLRDPKDELRPDERVQEIPV